MNMNPMQYDVTRAYQNEMQRVAEKQRMANAMNAARPSSRMVRSMVERVVQMAANVRVHNPQEAMPVRFEPKASS